MTKKILGISRRSMTLPRISRKKTMISAILVTLMKLNQKNKSMSKKLKITIATRLSKSPKNRFQSKMLLSQRKRKPQRLKTRKMNLVTSESSMNSKKSNQLPKTKKMTTTILETSMISRLKYKKLLLPS